MEIRKVTSRADSQCLWRKWRSWKGIAFTLLLELTASDYPNSVEFMRNISEI